MVGSVIHVGAKQLNALQAMSRILSQFSAIYWELMQILKDCSNMVIFTHLYKDAALLNALHP